MKRFICEWCGEPTYYDDEMPPGLMGQLMDAEQTLQAMAWCVWKEDNQVSMRFLERLESVRNALLGRVQEIAEDKYLEQMDAYKRAVLDFLMAVS